MGCGAAKHMMISLPFSISPRSLITTGNGCCKFLDCGYTIRVAQALHHKKCWPAMYSTNFLFTYFIETVESSVLTILEKWIRKLYLLSVANTDSLFHLSGTKFSLQVFSYRNPTNSKLLVYYILPYFFLIHCNKWGVIWLSSCDALNY